MKYVILRSAPLIVYCLASPASRAQTLDTADNASMAESMDQAIQAVEKMKAEYKSAAPAAYERWAKSRHFNVSYNGPKQQTATGKIATGAQAATPQQTQSKSASYTFIFQNKSSDSPCGGLVFALRRDMKDLGLSDGCPTPFDDKSVNGALFSYGGNAVNHNDTWTAQALGALSYSWTGFDLSNQSSQLIGFSTGIYASTNTILNSAKSLSKNNTEVYTYGMMGGLTIAPPNIGLYHNINFSIGGVTNDETNIGSYNETIRYSPAGEFGLGKSFSLTPLPLWFRFEGSLIGQFDQAAEDNKANRLAFNNQYDSVRVGPQIVFNLGANPSDDTPYAFLKGLSASLTYRWAY